MFVPAELAVDHSWRHVAILNFLLSFGRRVFVCVRVLPSAALFYRQYRNHGKEEEKANEALVLVSFSNA